MVKLSFLFITITIISQLLFTACQSHVYDSNVSCDITVDNEYIIKWDIFPKAEGDVKVYISDNPDSFNTDKTPVAVVNADEGVVAFPTPDPYKRHYFLLNFNDCFSRIVAARASFIQSAYDFRDLGGYSGNEDKKTKWGMIYRVGTLDTLTDVDKRRIRNINPKTLIEYRNKELCKYDTKELGIDKVVYLTPSSFDVDSIMNKVYEGDFTSDEARMVIRKYYQSMMDGDSKQCFIKMFNILTNEDNYPVIISSQYGKGFNDLASMFILTALGVSNNEIYEDYTWANKYFSKTKIMQKISHLPEDVREAVVSIIHNNHKDMLAVVDDIQNRYHSVDKYMVDSLALSLSKQQKLQQILLVDESDLLD